MNDLKNKLLELAKEARRNGCGVMGTRLDAIIETHLSAEQEERLSGVWIDGQWREIVVSERCPNCNGEGHTIGDPCGWNKIGFPVHGYIAPPAPAPKEPEMDEFEKWAEMTGNDNNPFSRGIKGALEKYRELVTRKGEQDGK